MSDIYKVQIPSNSPEIESCEVYLPKGEKEFGTGWMVTRFIDDILNSNKVVGSVALNKPNLQVTATLDTSKKPPRVAVLLGVNDPMDRKIVEIDANKTDGRTLVVYWKNWEITKVEWEGEELKNINEDLDK